MNFSKRLLASYGPPKAEVDREYEKSIEETGYCSNKAAGCLIFCFTTKRFLVARRSVFVQEPLTWGTWGGSADEGESDSDCAIRELSEETGYEGELELIPVFKFTDGDFSYQNYIAIVQREFEPVLTWETSDYRWLSLNNFPKPFHCGLESLLNDPKTIQLLESL